MNNNIVILLISLLPPVALMQCTSTSNVSGTGTETINTFVILPDGSPAKGAIAKVMDAQAWIGNVYHDQTTILKESSADKSGHVELCFEDSLPSLINLQIDHAQGGTVLLLSRDEWESIDTVFLEPCASFSGSMENGSSCISELLIAGTDYKTIVDAAGTFDFKQVAPGGYAILCLSEASGDRTVTGTNALTLDPGIETSDAVLKTDVNRVLIDNFESGIGPTSLGRIFPGLGWYVLTDSSYHYWDRTSGNWEAGVSIPIGASTVDFGPETDDDGNTYFKFETTLDEFSYFANAIIGLQLKEIAPEGIDLTSMSGFSFRAGGTGIIRVRFETAILDTSTNGRSHYTYILELTPQTETYTIPLDSMFIEKVLPEDEAEKYPWSLVGKNVLRIEIGFSATVNEQGTPLRLDFDDFYLEGIGLNSLLP